jgi:CheY-like chemotaxis protein
MKIGIVNDLTVATEALRRAVALEPAHEVVWTARDGREAVALCERNKPDLVLMDLIMPGMDGVEATRRIKAEPGLGDLPVIAYTARSSPLERIEGLFSAVCVKPCSPDALLTAVRKAVADA